LLSFKVLTPTAVTWADLLPGSLMGAVGFTVLLTVGAGLVQHQLRHSGATYGAFATAIGLVTFLLLLSKVTLYGAELNPVLTTGLWPRALPACPPTRADDEHLAALTHEQQRRPDQQIDVRFDANATDDPVPRDDSGPGRARAGRGVSVGETTATAERR
jgi:hypothetical protein